jgi:hypothetical protein
MLINVIIITIELIILFFLSRMVLNRIYGFFFLLTHSRPTAVTIITLLTFPGTIVHELSHLFTAEILGVRTGRLSLAPDTIRGDEVQAGSVTIQKTDPFRRTLIGTAPVTGGIIMLSTLSYFLMPFLTEIGNRLLAGMMPDIKEILLTLGSLFLLFSISNSMFSSKEDLKGSWAVLIVLGLLTGGAYFAGVRFSLTGIVLNVIEKILTLLSRSLALVLAINLLTFFLTEILIRIGRRLFRNRQKSLK